MSNTRENPSGGREIARLRVAALNPDHCGATLVREPGDDPSLRIAMWDTLYVAPASLLR